MIQLKTKLYPHQLNSLQFHMGKSRSGDWSEMGVGKTLISLAKLRLLYNSGIIQRALIIAPLSVLPVWASEIRKHTTFTYTVLQGSLENKLDLLHQKTPLFIVSYDSLPGRKRTINILLDAIIQRGFHFIILDEATYIKSASSLRTKAITKLCNIVNRTLFLSGTPITNDPESVLTIYRALDNGETFGKNFFAARYHFFDNRGYGFPDWHLRPETLKDFHRKLYYNCTRLLKDECLTLPPKVFTERYAELDGTQHRLYVDIARDLLKELRLPSGKVSIKNSLTKMSKLSQVANGFLYTDGGVQELENPKLDLLMDVLKEIGCKKVIIFCRWTHDISSITNRLCADNIGNITLSGATTDREFVIDSFINDPDVQVLVSQIHAGAYGLTLHVSSHTIYYSTGFSLIDFMQSQDRIHRHGQTETCVYIPLIMTGTIDKYIYDTLQMGVEIRKAILNIKSVNRLKHNLELICREV